MDNVYLDSAATTKPKKEVIEAMIPYLTEKWYNPSSLYSSAVNVKTDIEIARKTIADFINAEPEEIYFTSGASESNNWCLQGFAKENNSTNILATCIEHKSIVLCMNSLKNDIYDEIFVNKFGEVRLDDLEYLLTKSNNNEQLLVSVCMANNEIGTIQDIKSISDIVHKYHGTFHTDATQALGKIPIDVKKLGIDMMSASGHKLGCPKGIGFLYIKNGISIQPLIYGSQERGRRGGTENVAGIIGLAKAVELCDVSDKKVKELCEKRDYFLNLLEDYFACKLNGPRQPRLPNNINVTFTQNITGESLLYTLDLAGIKISTGSACNSHSVEPSHVLKAIGLSDEDAMKTVRFTLPDDITYEQINFVINEIDKTIMIIES